MNFKQRAQLYPRNILQKLGFERIREELNQQAASELGKKEIARISIYSHRPTISVLLNQVKEFAELIDDKDVLNPDTGYPSLADHVERLSIANSTLSSEQFVDIRTFLRQWSYLLKLTQKHSERWPDIDSLVSKYYYEKGILVAINAILDEKGEIRPEISPELARIRSDIKKTEGVQDKKFDAMLRHCQQEKWLSAEEQSFRNGRRVLALYSEYKRKIKGIIHDESSTGKTTFLEPQTLVELGNDLFDLRQQERKEIARILLDLSNEIRPYTESLEQYQLLAGKVDMIAAKAKLALKLEAKFPILSDKTVVYLHDAKHPLLKLSHEEAGKKVVPLNLELHRDQRILMVSGPNAGGKSICLKTVGLLQVMMQAGLLVPAHDHSKMAVFEKIFLDMGDDQSIENDLSTYSSHLKNLKHFINFSNDKTLVLLDEFGTGTDPQFGGAMAEAVLDHLVQKKAFGLATTHYSNLKLYAQKKNGVANASMLFDQENMKPTFKLEIGRPGSSYAFEIAQRIGLNKTVIEYARNKIGGKAGNYEQLVLQLEKEKLGLEQKLSSAVEKENRYKQLLEQYKTLKDELKQNKKKSALEYKTQLQNEIKNQNKRFEKLLGDIKSSKKSQEEVAKEIREKLNKDAKRVKAEVEKLEEEVIHSQSDHDILKVGDYVKMIDGNEVGFLEEIQGKQAIVAFNHLKTKVSLKQLQLSAETKKVKKSSGVSVRNYIMEFNSSIDVRGMRADEALKELEELIDHAVVLNHSKVRVIHGRGNGILKKQITEYIRSSGEVKHFDFEHPDFGGDGVTVITLQ